MKHQTTYAFLGFHFNSLVDSGAVLDITETHKKIQSKSLFPWLKEQFDSALDISLFSSDELNKIESFFRGLSSTMNERRKMGVEQNGLCLLIGYCFEATQRKEEDVY